MIRLAGAGLILFCGVWAWMLYLREERRRRAAVEELLYALHRIETEIRYEKEPLLPLLTQLGADCRGDAGEFFREFVRLHRAAPERSLSACWEEASAVLPLPEEGRSLWQGFIRRFGGDEAGVRAAAALTADGLRTLRAGQEAARMEKRKLSGAVCLTAAAFLVLLLL